MTEVTTNIPARLKNAAVDGHVAGVEDIVDDVSGMTQAEINADIDSTLTIHQNEINALNSQNYVSVTATEQTTAATDVLPATGEADTIYRVGSWDGAQYDATCYSEYAWKGDAYIHLSTKPQIGEVFDISAYHATDGELAKYADLTAALNSNNDGGVPQSLQKGGMSVKFVQTSDNKYVQYRLMAQSFSSDVDDWEETISIKALDGSESSDLDISDEDGNVLMRLANGHIQVKNFSSVDILDSIQAILSNVGFDNVPEFSEEEDYAIGDIVRHGKYVYVFTSAHAAGEWDNTEVEETVINTEHPVDVKTDNSTSDLDISDEDGNVLMRLANGHIKTKNFNSANIPSSVVVVPPKQYFPDFDVVSAPNYPDHDSTIVDNTIWAFHGNRYDVAAGFGGAVYDLNLNKLQDINTKFLWEKADGSGTQELEMKSVDFNPYNRVLAVGNGSARTSTMPNDSYIFLFYDCDDWLTAQGEVNFTNCGNYTKLNVSELGVKSYAFWASKNPISDQIIINVNFWKDFYLLRLGKGTNRLSHGNYVYIDNQKYNGTWDILNHWTTDLSSDTQAHGGQYYKGHLYIASNDSSRFIIYDFELNKDNSVITNEISCEARMDNSQSMKFQYPDGLCINNDIMYIQPLIVNGGSSINNKVVLKIKL